MANAPDLSDLIDVFKFCTHRRPPQRADSSALLCLQAISAHGVALNTLRDHQSNTLLHLAAQRGCRDAAEMLVRAGLSPSDMNSRAESPLKIAQDFKGYGKPYKSTFGFIKLISTAKNTTALEQILQQLGNCEQPSQLEPTVLRMVGRRVLLDFPGGPVQGVIQCLEDPSDPSSPVLINSVVGSDELISKLTMDEARKALVVIAQREATTALVEQQPDSTKRRRLPSRKVVDSTNGRSSCSQQKKPKITKTKAEGLKAEGLSSNAKKEKKKGACTLSTKKINSEWWKGLACHDGEQVECNGLTGVLCVNQKEASVELDIDGRATVMSLGRFAAHCQSTTKNSRLSITLASSGIQLGQAATAASSQIATLYGDDEDYAMCIIKRPPRPISDERLALQVMLQLNRLLKTTSWIVPEDGCCPLWFQNGSARLIQANRWEIFVSTNCDKPTTAFDDFLATPIEHTLNLPPGQAKSLLLDYIRQRATLDPRLMHASWRFGNFSLIVNYDKVAPQAPHIDLLRPGFQGGLIVTPDAPATHFFRNQGQVATVVDPATLAESWRADPDGPGAPSPNLVKALQEHPTVHELLKQFGHVLTPEAQMRRETKPPVQCGLHTGDILTLPGSVVHSGPASGFRAVVFFSAAKEGEEEYDPDTQFAGVHLLSYIVSSVWQMVGFQERKFLLSAIAKRIDACDVKGLHANLNNKNMSEFMEAVETNHAPDDTKEWSPASRATFFELKASDAALFPPDGLDDRASVEGLLVQYDGKDYEAIIYYCSRDHGHVVVYYPQSFQTEGREGGQKYILKMDHLGDLFDGTNGKLTHGEGGEEIKCRISRLKSHFA